MNRPVNWSMNQWIDNVMNYSIDLIHTFLFVDIAAAGAFFHVNIVKIIKDQSVHVFLYHYSGRNCLFPTQYRPKTLAFYTVLFVYIKICRLSMFVFLQIKENNNQQQFLFSLGSWGYSALLNLPISPLAPDIICFLSPSAFSSFFLLSLLS